MKHKFCNRRIQPGLPVREMFKKKKNKTKDDILNVHNGHQKSHSPKISSNSSTVLGDHDKNGDDSVDGFDPEGFVDLNPEEHQPKLLGPKQSCQVFEVFVVVGFFFTIITKFNFPFIAVFKTKWVLKLTSRFNTCHIPSSTSIIKLILSKIVSLLRRPVDGCLLHVFTH